MAPVAPKKHTSCEREDMSLLSLLCFFTSLLFLFHLLTPLLFLFYLIEIRSIMFYAADAVKTLKHARRISWGLGCDGYF